MQYLTLVSSKCLVLFVTSTSMSSTDVRRCSSLARRAISLICSSASLAFFSVIWCISLLSLWWEETAILLTAHVILDPAVGSLIMVAACFLHKVHNVKRNRKKSIFSCIYVSDRKLLNRFEIWGSHGSEHLDYNLLHYVSFLLLHWHESISLWNWTVNSPTHYPSARWQMCEDGRMVEWYWQEKTKWLRKKRVPVPLVPTYGAWTVLEANPGLHSETLATSCLCMLWHVLYYGTM
jgi:hypothetical protein